MLLRAFIIHFRPTVPLAFAFACLMSTSGTALGEQAFHLPEKLGRYTVGLRVVEQYDHSRTYRHTVDALGKPYQGERARPLQTLVWYPAEGTSAKRMTVGDYVNLWATETSFDYPKMPARGKDLLATLGSTLTTSLQAVRDASQVLERFPVVIYVPGSQETSWDNADLCEYLASFGYVVIGAPTLGVATHDITLDLAGLRAQAQDISFLIGYAETLTDTDASKVAVAGQSWGGFSNLFAAARDNRIDALVSLDGSLRYYPGLLKQADEVHPDQMSIPMLAFIQRDLPLEDQALYMTPAQRDGPNVLNEWTHGDLVTVHMLGLSHAAFTSLSQRREDWWWAVAHVWPMRQGDYGRDDAMKGYGWMAHYTLRFLDAYLKHDAVAMTFLQKTPAANGVPPHVMAVSYRAASAGLVSFEAFRAEIGRAGFDHLEDIYASFQKIQSDFKPTEGMLADWADELVSDNHLSEAIAVLKLTVAIYPDSTGAYARLGDVYRRGGKKQLAIESYEEALDKDPKNGFVRWKVEGLSARGPRDQRVVSLHQVSH